MLGENSASYLQQVLKQTNKNLQGRTVSDYLKNKGSIKKAAMINQLVVNY